MPRSMIRLIANVLLFQLSWWTTILAAARGLAWVGPLVVGIVLVLHCLWIAPQARREWWLLPAAALLGYAADTVLTVSGWLLFDHRLIPGLPTPLWMLGLWIAFNTTTTAAFAVLRSHLLIAALVGGVSGPLAYYAGAKLDALQLAAPIWQSLTAIALAWAIALPLVLFAIDRSLQSPAKAARLEPTTSIPEAP